MSARYAINAKVRGNGFTLSMKLVTDRATKKAAVNRANPCFQKDWYCSPVADAIMSHER